tara:strand:+ start:137 stop:772 length:636 start_codon:yes stop_codon:yes gene_type:complete
MSDYVVKKLKRVYLQAPILLQPRIAAIIHAIGVNSPQSVTSPILDPISFEESTTSLLEDNSDNFLSLMRTLSNKHPLKEKLSKIERAADSLQKSLKEAGEELSKVLKSDEEEMKGIGASALSQLAEQLGVESSKVSEFVELGKKLATLAGKADKEEKDSPVKHSLPSKEEEDAGESKDEKEKTPSPMPENPGGRKSKPSADDEALEEIFKS